jgi:hypothetical protein
MDPISTTYGSSSSTEAFNAYQTRRQSETSPGAKPGQTGVQASPSNTTTENAAVQLGIQPSKDAKAEFRPYGPEQTRQTGLPAATPAPGQRDIQSAQPGETDNKDPQVQQLITQLKATEEKVKAHEAAHKSGGAATGPISYSYTRGPDGRNYITGGEVPITISTGSTPQETISRMQQVIQAALAPADPSPQDRAVAAQAAAMQQAARQEQSDISQPEAKKPPATASTGNDVNVEGPQNGFSAQQSQRAYSDPAVTGKESTFSIHSALQPHKYNQESASIGTSNQADISSGTTSGFGPSRSVSFYS